MTARRFQMVFFDATDTLLRVRGGVGAVYAPVAARHGFDTTPEAIDRHFGPAIRSAPPPAFPDAAAADLDRLERDWWRDVVRRTFAPLGPFAGFEPFFAELFELFRTAAAWELLPGARETLAALRDQGRGLGIVSEMDARLHDALAAFDLARFFGPVILSMRTGASKHDGGLFRVALARTGIEAARAVHVGDSLRLDVEGARSAGLAAVHLDPGGTSPPGVPSIRTLPELPARLAELEAS